MPYQITIMIIKNKFLDLIIKNDNCIPMNASIAKPGFCQRYFESIMATYLRQL